ncbi:MAG: glucan biosynthesis protein [Rhodobiaceae bacterium]|nr:glucan biosynthesis protein [Rhodobiaceae bacterium]
MNRRDFFAGGAAAAALVPFVRQLAENGLGFIGTAQAADEGRPFDRQWLVELARKLATQDFKPLETGLPDPLPSLTYDQYRAIRFRPDAALWKDEGRGYTIDLFHAGFYFKIPVLMFVVDEGVATRIHFTPDMFDYGPEVPPIPQDQDLPFSGFRARRPINNSDVWDEFLVFQGASYFRAVGKGQQYGLSARGLAIGTASAGGEEFPAFTRFYLERPGPGARVLVVHALLQSESATGAYRFTVRAGDETVMDVEATIFARKPIENIGLAPLTSMFMYDSTNRGRFDDWRNAVHDSDGLLMINWAGERLWRPLANPELLQISAFVDRGPQGFGLIQRRHAFTDFQDLEARYDLRPSLWVEPVGDWGEGSVVLVEIPTDREVHDNIVAYWRPAKPVTSEGPLQFTYRLRWGNGPVGEGIGIVAATRMGRNFNQDREIAVIDFEGATFDPGATVELSNSAGVVSRQNLQPNPVTGGMRASFEFDPQGAELIEFRLRVVAGDRPLTETWIYRWTA